jgi:hypothetical protein
VLAGKWAGGTGCPESLFGILLSTPFGALVFVSFSVAMPDTSLSIKRPTDAVGEAARLNGAVLLSHPDYDRRFWILTKSTFLQGSTKW